MPAHSASGEDVAFIDPSTDSEGKYTAGVYNSSLSFGLSMEVVKSQLPWLINWQHWGENEYVVALEPGTNPPIGQAKAREEGVLIQLEPGESKEYRLDFQIVTSEEDVKKLLSINNI